MLLLDGSDDLSAAVLSTTGVVRFIQAADTGSGAEIDVVIASACAAEFSGGSNSSNVTLQQISPDAKPVECQSVGTGPAQGS